jgi:hypothetical protein
VQDVLVGVEKSAVSPTSAMPGAPSSIMVSLARTRPRVDDEHAYRYGGSVPIGYLIPVALVAAVGQPWPWPP